jgi:hypothetical protein
MNPLNSEILNGQEHGNSPPSKGGDVNKCSKLNTKIQHNLRKTILPLEALSYTIGTPDKLNSKASTRCNQLYNSIINS